MGVAQGEGTIHHPIRDKLGRSLRRDSHNRGQWENTGGGYSLNNPMGLQTTQNFPDRGEGINID